MSAQYMASIRMVTIAGHCLEEWEMSDGTTFAEIDGRRARFSYEECFKHLCGLATKNKPMIFAAERGDNSNDLTANDRLPHSPFSELVW